MKTPTLLSRHWPVLLAAGTVLGVVTSAFAFRSAPEADVAAAPPAPLIKAAQLLEHAHPGRLQLQSQVALVLDTHDGTALVAREIDTPRPIASLTKIMTALVILESGLPLDEPVTITHEDRDRLKGSHSRLRVGSILTRDDLLRAALAASDNHAAAALARSYPGGREAFVAAMNTRAAALGMSRTRFADASGLDRRNVSTARDLARLAEAADTQPRLAVYSTRNEVWVTDLATGHPLAWNNTNRLVRNEHWEIGLSKTGYTADAGNCLLLHAKIGERPVRIVLLNSWGKLSKYGDARRIHDWLLEAERRALRTLTPAVI